MPMHYQEDVPVSHGRNEFQNANLDVDFRNTKRLDSGASPSEQGWLTEGSDVSRDFSGKSPGSQEGSNHESPSPKSPSHQLYSVKPQSSRQRTPQACDKCRERKTKCSGNHPVCLRCASRGLICEYTMRETRLRTPARARSHNARRFPETRQPEYTGHDRPTPAHHSRIGGRRTNAFAPGPGPSSSPYSTQVSNPTSTPNIPIPTRTDMRPTSNQSSQHNRTQQTRQLASTHGLFSDHSSAPMDPSYGSSGAAWSYDANIPLNFDYGDSSYNPALLQPPYPSINIHEERSTTNTNHISMSMPESSLRQMDYEMSNLLLPSVPALQRVQDYEPRPFYLPPYISNINPTYNNGGRHLIDSPMYHANTNNSPASTLASTPMGSQLELACPTPSIPIDPATFRDMDGISSRTFFNPPPEIRYPTPLPIPDRGDYFGYSSFK